MYKCTYILTLVNYYKLYKCTNQLYEEYVMVSLIA